MTAQEKEINLLPKEKWETGVIGKLLKWALQVGRYVVVFTELIVIGAFLYRFGLDRQLTDLHEGIKQKTSVLTSYGDLEQKFKRVQTQLQTIRTTENSGLDTENILTAISQITPLDTVYKSIEMKGDSVHLEGESLSEMGLATLLVKAQGQSLFSEVALENVSSASEKGQLIEFRLVLSLEKVKQEKR